MDGNKVSVKIYGQDYVVAGDKTREHMMKVADYVNTKMYDIAAISKGTSLSDLGVLAAVNVADDYFDALEEANRLKSESVQLEKDMEHYVQLWEEAKKTIIGYKEDSQTIIQQKNELMKTIETKEEEIRRLSDANQEVEAKAAMASQNIVNELETKCRELENNFFDVQMENIQLKSEVERLRRGE
jgi:cell division protein ZapA